MLQFLSQRYSKRRRGISSSSYSPAKNSDPRDADQVGKGVVPLHLSKRESSMVSTDIPVEDIKSASEIARERKKSEIVLIGRRDDFISPPLKGDTQNAKGLTTLHQRMPRPPRNVIQCRVELLDGAYYTVQLPVRLCLKLSQKFC